MNTTVVLLIKIYSWARIRNSQLFATIDKVYFWLSFMYLNLSQLIYSFSNTANSIQNKQCSVSMILKIS